MTSRSLLLFETRKPQFTWEPADHYGSNCHDDPKPEHTKSSASAEIYDEARIENPTPLSPPPWGDALPYVEPVYWDFEVSALDAVALRLLETSDFNMMADQPLSKYKDIVESPRKDSLGSDLFFDETTFQMWRDERSDNDLPTMGISSGLFDVDGDESWPCLNRIPSPSPSEAEGLVEDVSWENVLQDTFPITSCGILPSCASSGPSVDYTLCSAPQTERCQFNRGDDRNINETQQISLDESGNKLSRRLACIASNCTWNDVHHNNWSLSPHLSLVSGVLSSSAAISARDQCPNSTSSSQTQMAIENTRMSNSCMKCRKSKKKCQHESSRLLL